MSQACNYGYLRIVVTILNKFQLKIDLKGLNPSEILASACQNGYYQIVKMLLKKFEELEIDLKEFTPKRSLAIACGYGHFKIVEIFLNKFAELKIDMNDLNDFWQYKMSPCNNIVQSQNLISENESTLYGYRTAFQIVCIRGHSKLAELLILKSKGAKFSQRFFLKDHMAHASSINNHFKSQRLTQDEHKKFTLHS